jgi:hypothetical protein
MTNYRSRWQFGAPDVTLSLSKGARKGLCPLWFDTLTMTTLYIISSLEFLKIL